MSKVVHCKKEKYDVYIGRPSIWGNPFVIGKHGDREYCILKYKLWLNTRPDLLLKIPELREKVLGCWCENLPCHGDVLIMLSSSKYISNWFSNMKEMDTPFTYDGMVFKTSENFYQAMKTTDRDTRLYIAGLNPYKSKTEIRKFEKRSDWKEIKLDVMEYILKVKFGKNTSFRKMLMMTEDWLITEWNNWGDTFWGIDIRTGKGENNLGKILMKLRDNNV